MQEEIKIKIQPTYALEDLAPLYRKDLATLRNTWRQYLPEPDAGKRPMLWYAKTILPLFYGKDVVITASQYPQQTH